MRRQPNNPAGTRLIISGLEKGTFSSLNNGAPPRRPRSGDNPMTTFRTLLAAATLVGAAASSNAFAAPLSVVNQGEAFSVQY
jgi:hypothetical protein